MIVETSTINGQIETANAREIADIELSVMNGIDVLMIDQETCIGKAPVESVRIVAKALA